MAIDCTGELSTGTGIDGSTVLCNDGEWVRAPEPLYQLYELLNEVFTTPEPLDIGAAFMVGVSLPLICYLVAWAYGSVIQFASRNHNDLDD